MNELNYNTLPEFYHKEQCGIKSNTVRAVDTDDYLQIKDADLITIHNKVTGDQFTRRITDISVIGYILNKKDIVISWDHEEGAY